MTHQAPPPLSVPAPDDPDAKLELRRVIYEVRGALDPIHRTFELKIALEQEKEAFLLVSLGRRDGVAHGLTFTFHVNGTAMCDDGGVISSMDWGSARKRLILRVMQECQNEAQAAVSAAGELTLLLMDS